jgi:hypothetical protein
MIDPLNERITEVCKELSTKRGDINVTEEEAAKLLYTGSNLVTAATMREKPHWFLISSLLAYMEDFSRWVIEAKSIREAS